MREPFNENDNLDGYLGATFLAAVSGDMELAPFMSVGIIKPLALIAGEMYTAKDENGILVGFTIWVPPGRSALDRYIMSSTLSLL